MNRILCITNMQCPIPRPNVIMATSAKLNKDVSMYSITLDAVYTVLVMNPPCIKHVKRHRRENQD